MLQKMVEVPVLVIVARHWQVSGKGLERNEQGGCSTVIQLTSLEREF